MRWKKISGFDGYEVSECGLIRSLERMVLTTAGRYGRPHYKKVNERILKPAISGSGYFFLTLRKGGRHFNKRVHVIVAESFIGTRPKGLIVCHKDNDKLNNHYSNLEYGTMAKNSQDYYKSLGKCIGSVPISHIPGIISRISSGEKIYKIAMEYNVSRDDIATLNRIISLNEVKLAV